MRKPAWGGESPPRNDTEARGRLLDATWRCIRRFGPERTTLADVSAEARVTRQTVYRYFKTGEDLLRAALVIAGGGILERMTAHARSFDSPGDRIAEAFLFLWREVPADPHLGPVFGPAEDRRRADSDLWSEFAMEVSRNTLRGLVDEWSRLSRKELDELAELMVRLLRSFITDLGPHRRDEAELRAFLHRWVLPSIGLPGRAMA